MVLMDSPDPADEEIPILLADAHPVVRAGIRAILNNTPDIRIVGEAENGFDVQQLISELMPSVLILDLQMPGPKPADLALWVCQNYPGTDVIILTAHVRDAYLSIMLDAGVSGFLLKNEPSQNLITAIRRAARSESLFSNDQLERELRWHNEVGVKWFSLSQKEKEILRLMTMGKNNASLAVEMKVASKTIAYHLTNIFTKLDVNSRSEAIAWVNKCAPRNLEEIRS
jgi:DNA-binding NarL/FixJ family response regulator